MAGRVLFTESGWLLGLLLVAATIIAYQPAWHGDLSGTMTRISPPTRRCVRERFVGHLVQTRRDLPVLSVKFHHLLADYHLWGLNPLAIICRNLLLHGLVACCCGSAEAIEGAGRLAGGSHFRAASGERMSVAWMTELKNTLSGRWFWEQPGLPALCGTGGL